MNAMLANGLDRILFATPKAVVGVVLRNSNWISPQKTPLGRGLNCRRTTELSEKRPKSRETFQNPKDDS